MKTSCTFTRPPVWGAPSVGYISRNQAASLLRGARRRNGGKANVRRLSGWRYIIADAECIITHHESEEKPSTIWTASESHNA